MIIKELLQLREDKGLTLTRKKQLVSDFKEWSGGSNPTEVHWDKEDENDEPGVAFYIEDNGLTKAEAKFFEDLYDGVEDIKDYV